MVQVPISRGALRFWIVVIALVTGMTFVGPGLRSGEAQILSRIAGGFSPLMPMPPVMGEARVRPVGTWIENGTVRLGQNRKSWNLKDQFRMNRTYLFIDTMVRFQISRVSLRFNYEPREFVGVAPTGPTLTTYSEARLDYTGIRLGLDLDVFQWGRSRIGANVDYSLYKPIFTRTIPDDHPTFCEKIIGEAPATLGFHIMYIPTWNFYGFAPLFETRCRWPAQFLSTTSETDLEFAVGLKSPETVLGSFSVNCGYRQTKLKCSGGHIIDFSTVNLTATPPTGPTEGGGGPRTWM